MTPVSGSAYTYSYAVLGESLCWLIGWNLLLEYTLVVAVVAIGIAGYLGEVLSGVGLTLPTWATSGYFVGYGGVNNLLAVLLCLLYRRVADPRDRGEHQVKHRDGCPEAGDNRLRDRGGCLLRRPG
jgi:amino acid transporter